MAQATQKALLRDSDKIFRYGGEEFTTILAGGGQYSAMTVAQRILEEVAALHLPKKTAGSVVRLSFGPETTFEEIDACVEALHRHHDTRMPML